MTPRMQMCTVDDMTGEEPCRRLAQWTWQPEGPETHPVFLCNFHAEPLTSSPGFMEGISDAPPDHA